MQKIISVLLFYLLVASCCYEKPYSSDVWNFNKQQADSLSFYLTHHYTQNFNFSVRSDSLCLVVQSPSEFLSGFSVDTICVYNSDKIVVADITKMPSDTLDSIWVKVARDQLTIGWIRETELLSGVTPDTPISILLDYSSHVNIIIGFTLLALFCFLFPLRRFLNIGSKMVFFNDIQSFYPKMLCLLVATSAVLYSSILLFAHDSWLHFYYNPTLNPFVLPLHLAAFLLFVWGVIIFCIATIEDVFKILCPNEAFFYLLGLFGACFLFYLLFRVLTFYYVGYLLYSFFVYFQLRFFYK